MAYGERERSDRGAGAGAGAGAAGAARSKVFFRRRKECPLSGKNAPSVDYKDPRLLLRFMSERGKILPTRITAVKANKQREVTQAIKRARILALVPYVNS